MKANEFVKEFGLEYAKHILNEDSVILVDLDYTHLKRLVESHELVGSKGGLTKAKEVLADNPVWCFGSKRYSSPLEEAIADVESCMEVNQ